MTTEAFVAFYPQFASVNETVLDEFVAESNLRFEDCLDAAERARRLWIAHELTLYAQTFVAVPEEMSPDLAMKKLSGAGVAAQALSKSVGGVSVSKSEGSAVNSIYGFGELKQTAFGLQLIQLLKIATAGGRYVR